MTTANNPSPFETNVQLAGVLAKAQTAALARVLDQLDDYFGGPVSKVTQASFILRGLRAEGYDITGTTGDVVGVDEMVAALNEAERDVEANDGAVFSGTSALAAFLHDHLTGVIVE